VKWLDYEAFEFFLFIWILYYFVILTITGMTLEFSPGWKEHVVGMLLWIGVGAWVLYRRYHRAGLLKFDTVEKISCSSQWWAVAFAVVPLVMLFILFIWWSARNAAFSRGAIYAPLP